MTDANSDATAPLLAVLDRLEQLEHDLGVIAKRAGVADDAPHQATARKEAEFVREITEERINRLAATYDAAFEKGRAETQLAKTELMLQIEDAKQHSTELSLAAGVAAGRAAAVVEEKLNQVSLRQSKIVEKLQTTVEEVQGNVTVVLTALVTMQKTNMKMLGAAVLIGGVLIFVLSRALGF